MGNSRGRRRKLGTEIQRTRPHRDNEVVEGMAERGSAVPLGVKPQTLDPIAEHCPNKSRCMIRERGGCSDKCNVYRSIAKNLAEKANR
jgi:hypothetical protein